MKKIMFAAVSALALSALADGVSSTQFGAMQVVSKDARTLVAIPWDNTAAGGGDIAVSNLVLTANLTKGDTLDVLSTNGESLCHWTLNEGTGGVLYWEAPVNDVEEGDGDGIATVTAGTASDVATIKRGSSVILIRSKPVYVDGDTLPTGKNAGDAVPFYVMGQVAGSTISTTIVAGTSANPCYNMIAPPSTEPQLLNDSETGAVWSGNTPSSADRIFIPNGTSPSIELVYTQEGSSKDTRTGDSYWCSMSDLKKKVGTIEIKYGVQYTKYTTAIPVGTGFWYCSRGGSPTVTWHDVPTTK